MKIEVLFPEICNLYGDLANIRYLKECLPDAEVINTSLQTRPRFLEEPVDLVYMGTTTENGQILALDQLRFYREQIMEQVKTDPGLKKQYLRYFTDFIKLGDVNVDSMKRNEA